MSCDTDGILQALQHTASQQVEALVSASHEHETWLAQKGCEALELLRAIAPAKGDSTGNSADGKENAPGGVPTGQAGKRRRRARPALETVAEEGPSCENKETADPEVENEQEEQPQPADGTRRQPGRKAKAQQAEKEPVVGKRMTRSRSKAHPRDPSNSPAADVKAPREAPVLENQAEGLSPATAVETAVPPDAEQQIQESAASAQPDLKARMSIAAQHPAAPATSFSFPTPPEPDTTTEGATPASAAPQTPNMLAQAVAAGPSSAGTELHEDMAGSGDGTRPNITEACCTNAAEAAEPRGAASEAAKDESLGDPRAGLPIPAEQTAASQSDTQPQVPASPSALQQGVPTAHVRTPQAEQQAEGGQQQATAERSRQPAAPPADLEAQEASLSLLSNPSAARQFEKQGADACPSHPASPDGLAPVEEGSGPQAAASPSEHASLHICSPGRSQDDEQHTAEEDAMGQDTVVMAQSPPDASLWAAAPGVASTHAGVSSDQAATGSSNASSASVASAGKTAGGAVMNLVSSIRSFLPAGAAKDGPAPRKPVRVKALEAAEAARRKDDARAAERSKQRNVIEQQKVDRVKHAMEVKARQEEEQRRRAAEAKRAEHAQLKREEEAAAQRRAREEAEKRERREKQQRLEEAKQKKRLQEQQAKAHAALPKPMQLDEERKRKAAAIAQELDAKRAKAAQNAAAAPSQAVQPGPTSHAATVPAIPVLAGGRATPNAAQARAGAGATLPPSRLQQTSYATDPPPSGNSAPTQQAAQHAAGAAVPLPPKPVPRYTPAKERVQQDQSYQISPYRDDSEEDSEAEEAAPRKPVPAWARGRELMNQLVAQLAVDPDDIFQQRQRTCALDDVFSAPARPQPGKRDLKERRTSTSNWIEDRVTWQEEKQYKRAMGYLK